MATDLRDRLQAALGDSYVVDRELSGGRLSRLFLATERSLERPVVIKVLPPELTSEVSAARFQRETQVTALLQHPHILPVHAAGARDGLLYYVSPFIEGESLRRRLERGGQLPIADALRILREVADGLAFAHARGVLHRDVKPENILLEHGHALLADFGIARAVEAARTGTGGLLTETGVPVGTPGYMAPEQLAAEPHIDARADVYALAVVGYEMLAGRPPFSGPSLRAVLAAHLTETPRPLDELCPDTPPHVSAAIMKALAKSPDGRFATAAEFRDALDSPHAYGRARPRMRRRRVISAAAALLAVAVGGALISRDGGDDAALDSNLVAVAPFDVLGSDLRLWREGLVDLLSRNLDGAGALRTVAPTVVVRRWRGRADVPSATALARRSGARLAVFGTLTRSGTDSVRLAASLLDAGTRRVLTEVELRDVESHTDRLADSVTVAVLRELGRSRPVRAVRGAGVGSRSVPALKAYLQAEQFYRRGGWDSAVAYSERAIALDSTMALAWRRAALARTWRTSKVDSLANRYALRAGALNRGLPPRDSLLIVADSIRGALEAIQIWLADTTHLVTVRRHAATLEELVRRYPDDPEGWYELGDARLHIGSLFGVNPGKALEAFERSIALDSAFAPAYPHTIELGVALRGMAAIRRYAANYRALSPLDTAAWLAAVALDPAADPRAVRRMLDTVSADALYYAISLLHAWPDSAETVLGMCRRLLSGGNRRGQISAADQAAVCVQSQAYHGRLGEAYRTSARYGLQGPDIDWNDVQMALLGMMPADSAARRFANWLRRDLNYAFRALPWWVSRGDTAAISAVVRLADSIARSSPPTVQSVRFAPSAAQAARGYLALTRGDTTEAMRRLPALPDSARCCLHEELLAARLLQKRGRHHEAAQLLLARETPEPMVVAVLWMLERGRVFKRLGDRERAISSYRFVADVWAHADPELQPYVAEARRALEELRAAGRQRARPSPHQK